MDNNALEIVVWNVEHGSAIYAKTPNGRSIVMDAGASSDFSPSLWLRTKHNVEQVDLFTLSHADADHIDDITEFVKLEPRSYIRNKTVPSDLVYAAFPPNKDPHKTFYEFDSRYTDPVPPDSPLSLRPVDNWGGVTISAFWCGAPQYRFADLNDYSLVTILLYGNLEFVFPGDLEAPGWEALLKVDAFRRQCTPSTSNPDEIRILVAPHHGRRAGVHQPLLDLLRPHLTLMSDKYGNETTDYRTYYNGSLGHPVYDSGSMRTERKYVVTTKTNNYILVVASDKVVTVRV